MSYSLELLQAFSIPQEKIKEVLATYPEETIKKTSSLLLDFLQSLRPKSYNAPKVSTTLPPLAAAMESCPCFSHYLQSPSFFIQILTTRCWKHTILGFAKKTLGKGTFKKASVAILHLSTAFKATLQCVKTSMRISGKGVPSEEVSLRAKSAYQEKACYDLFGYHSPGIVATYLTLLEKGLYEKRPQDLRLLSFQKHYRLGSLSSELSIESASYTLALFGPTPQGEVNRNRASSLLLQGLSTIHSKNLIHRDIKLENTLLDGDKGTLEDIVIADFGSSCSISEAPEAEISGTREYLAPEIHKSKTLIERQRAVTQKADVWALGLVLARIYLPFWKTLSDPTSQAYVRAIEGIFSQQGMRAVSYLKGLTQETFLPPSPDPMQNLIYDMLRIDPPQRITSKEALSLWHQIPQTTTN